MTDVRCLTVVVCPLLFSKKVCGGVGRVVRVLRAACCCALVDVI